MMSLLNQEPDVSHSNQVAPVIRSTITPAELVAVLQEAGFRAEVVNGEKPPRVRSGVQGLTFSIGFPSQPDAAQRYSDFSFNCPLRIKGGLPDDLLERWNRSKRFARLLRNEHFLYVTMDVMLAGGVTQQHLHAQLELWDHLIRELFVHLQQPLQTDSIQPLATQSAALSSLRSGAAGHEASPSMQAQA
jgi:hypothetical protein